MGFGGKAASYLHRFNRHVFNAGQELQAEGNTMMYASLPKDENPFPNFRKCGLNPYVV